MNDKFQSDIFKTLATAIFAGISYLGADCFQITSLLFNFSDPMWHVTVSVAIYTAILNSLLLFLLSKRTSVKVNITERKDKSNKISLTDKPRTTEIKIAVRGNLSKITGMIEVIFPKWVDIMTKGSPDLKQCEDDSQKYFIDLSGIVENSQSEVSLFYFDITMNPLYEETGRSGEIIAKIHGNSLRYSKNTSKLTIHYKTE
ncbi:hypothetical protein HMPREF9372_1290 [Sporosarcina newyorkensis 2681]|uniref:Uncharacterized protein n=1 Tax=Sporosarcina newyorkensis 2681 TaxID=1027292 RepID=F9DR60_9BACL|nr:hypothetical protein [Sporosarcina newyorkensis]EGQ26749.1 hypothetical protein HMPREF9372_1290 [Sporosarcina newyorkensis 2681]